MRTHKIDITPLPLSPNAETNHGSEVKQPNESHPLNNYSTNSMQQLIPFLSSLDRANLSSVAKAFKRLGSSDTNPLVQHVRLLHQWESIIKQEKTGWIGRQPYLNGNGQHCY